MRLLRANCEDVIMIPTTHRALVGVTLLVLSSAPALAQQADIPLPPFMPGAPAPDLSVLPPAPIVEQVVRAPAAHRQHTVMKGDTFWTLAKAYYGKGAEWKVIADANPAAKAKGLVVGSMIVVP